jgi:hypothetical protein
VPPSKEPVTLSLPSGAMKITRFSAKPSNTQRRAWRSAGCGNPDHPKESITKPRIGKSYNYLCHRIKFGGTALNRHHIRIPKVIGHNDSRPTAEDPQAAYLNPCQNRH